MKLIKTLSTFIVVVLVLVSVTVGSMFPPISITASTGQNKVAEIKFLNYVEVAIVKKLKLLSPSQIIAGGIGGGKVVLMNITPIDSTFQLNSTCTGCNTCLGSGSVLKTSTVVEVEKHGTRLRFIEISVSNDTDDDSYTFYLLEYRAERINYNVTILTRIFTDPEDPDSYVLLQTIANIEPKNPLPVADVVKIVNRTFLSEHYEVLAKTLEKLAFIEGETRDVWRYLAKELRNLAWMVKKYLAKYDKEAYGTALIIDGPWRWLCVLICNIACAVGCNVGTALICAVACGKVCAGCVMIWGCPLCLACTIGCAAISGAVCQVIGQYGCSPGCDWLCEKAGW